MLRGLIDWTRGHFGWSIASVALAGLVLRVGYVLVVGPQAPIGMDAAWYAVEGQAIADGRGYVDPRLFLTHGSSVPTANFPPLWPGLLGVVDLFGFDSTFQNRLVGTVVGTVTIVLAGLLGRRVAGHSVGLVAAVLVAACPMLVAADGSLMAESLYVALITGAVLAAYRALEHPSVIRFAVVGVLIGLAALTRSDALFLAPIMVVVLAWRAEVASTAKRVALVVAMVGFVALPVASFSLYSSTRMDGLVLTTSNSGNMVTGANCPTTYSGPLLGAWDARCAHSLAPGHNEITWAADARSAGITYAREHVGRLPLVATVRTLRVWGLWKPIQQRDLEAIESRNPTWQLVGWGYDLVLLVAAGAGAVVLRRRGARLAPMIAVVLGVVVAAALSNGNQRFRLAADPILAVCAAAVVVIVAHRLLDRRPVDPDVVVPGPS